MEENNENNNETVNNQNPAEDALKQESEQTVNKGNHVCFENHCWKKCLAMVLAAFAGGFLAVYFVSDQIAERHIQKYQSKHHAPKYDNYLKRQKIDPIYERNLREFERAFEHDDLDDDFLSLKMPEIRMPEIRMPDFTADGVNIKTDIDEDEYKIKIGLTPFNDDESKINYNVTGRKLTVFGSSEVKNDNYSENIAFSQDFILPDNADRTAIKKVKKGKTLIISVPLK